MATLNGSAASPEALQALALTNYGHFTTMVVEDGGVRGLALHLARLVGDCRAVFGAELDPEWVRECVRREAAGHTGAVTVRVTVFDPELNLAAPERAARPGVLVTTRPAPGTGHPLPALRVRRLRFERESPSVKHVSLFGQLRMRREARLAGFDDVLFVGADGLVSEGCTWNIGFVDEAGTVVWPQADVLPGTTMRLLRAGREGQVTAPMTDGRLRSMRAAFATNTSIGVRPVAAVDDVAFRVDDPVIGALRETYAAVPLDRL
ncbi:MULTISPECIES: aminotransferase class IV [unclassified Streptomyces]|uniref:aminotransferase class IV n=1 Tax=unclassified Streptomyces TaxID=2593676 RepID=UPI001BE8E1E8|nr:MULTISPECIES: aminotransferase class IV [unclassified Streptomyces]MBT2406557.1 aminotransferase class IV [Streptomyces sp. ISL-21]MBT2458025.1 aminotransferase class IV [Streptomyces sp. ISL-86]MBT2608895.1 aminotransferase class IV [Streptomyces sp. ISL-87]